MPPNTATLRQTCSPRRLVGTASGCEDAHAPVGAWPRAPGALVPDGSAGRRGPSEPARRGTEAGSRETWGCGRRHPGAGPQGFSKASLELCSVSLQPHSADAAGSRDGGPGPWQGHHPVAEPAAWTQGPRGPTPALGSAPRTTDGRDPRVRGWCREATYIVTSRRKPHSGWEMAGWGGRWRPGARPARPPWEGRAAGPPCVTAEALAPRVNPLEMNTSHNVNDP